MKNIYLCQFSIINEQKFVLLPYSAGMIQAYAQSIDSINREYQFHSDIFFIPDKKKNIINQIINPHIVGFGVYIWNLDFSDSIAKEIKKKYKDCLIVYGGPQVPEDEEDFLRKRPWVDKLIHKEGEISFSNFLLNDDCNHERIRELDSLPSPYLSGIFNHYFSKYDNYVLNAILETNRGCPYKCTFCDWGGITYSKVHKFDTDRIFKELEWFSENKIEHITCTDANFGIFKERDEKIVDKIISIKEETGYPFAFNTNWAKNSNENILNIASKLKKASMLRKMGLSLQSLNLDVLTNVKRKNMELNNLTLMLKKARKKDLEVMVEMILNLPGETKETWIENYCNLLANDNIFIDSYPLTVLKNSELGKKEYIKKYNIKTVKSKTNYGGGLKSKEEIVVSTENMTKKEYHEAWLFTWFLRSMHSNGYLYFIYKFMNIEYNMSIRKFYEFIFESKNNTIEMLIDSRKDLLENNLYNDFYYNNDWIYLIEKRRNLFYEELKILLKQNFEFEYFDELIDFQNISFYNDKISYPIRKKFDYNFFNHRKEPVTLKFTHGGIGSHENFKSFLSLSRSHNWKCEVEYT